MGLGEVAPRVRHPDGGPMIPRSLARTRSPRVGLGNERGATIVFVALAITALLSIVALAIDIGMLFSARSEAQRVADAAALAGAGSLIGEPNNADRARRWAKEYGGFNDIRGDAAVVLDEDVDVDLARARVTVTARRVASRESAVPTWFARVFGVDAVDVSARATAEATPTGRAVCVKPFTLMDPFKDVDGDGVFEPDDGDTYDPSTHGYGSSWRNPGMPGDDGQGYLNDRGRQVVIKGGGPGSLTSGTGPGWYEPWDVEQTGDGVCSGGPGGTGASCYRWAVENCHPAVVEVGKEYWVADGAMSGPTETGIKNMINKDASAYWDTSCQCVKGSKHGDYWEASERIGIVPTFDPRREFKPGKRPIEFTNFIALYFEKVEGSGTNQRVYARVLYAAGIAGGSVNAPMTRVVRLVD